ncbi:MAG: carbohydrate kinase family protein [Demequina sp.]|uniref:carbohydrate kinase family protein n=1 Tax=Demequina sp. TaxID=2050685 RepID=UPI003A8B47B8
MSAAPRVVVCGPSAWNHLIVLDDLPAPRPHMRFAREAWWTVGGTSAGKALHLLDRGADVTLVTPIGADEAGERLLAALRATGLDVVALPADVTESHTNLMTEAGERVSLYTAVPQSPSPAALATAQAACEGADALVVDLSPLGLAVLPRAVATGAPLWTDLHDWDGVADFHRPFARAASTVLLNDDGAADGRAVMASVLGERTRLAIRTLGSAGAEALDADGTVTTVPAVPCDVVDTNGAGDAFAAGALMAQLSGAPIERMLTAGTQQAVRALSSRHLCPLLDGR